MAAALPGIIAGGSSLLQANSRNQAAGQFGQDAELTASQLEVEAKGEELGAIQREADRKRELSKALASQIAGAGARGISAFEGSPLTILNEDIKEEQRATQRDLFNTRISALTKRATASSTLAFGGVKSSLAKQTALIGLLGDTAKIAEVV